MVSNMTPPHRIEGQTFVGANVQIDGGAAYVKCNFVNCNLVYVGVGPVQLQENTFDGCNWSFAGPAGNTISFLKSIYPGGGKEMVENVFREIRGEAPVAAKVDPKKGSIQ